MTGAAVTSVLLGDCMERMRELAPASIDAVVCDPPYGLEFMGKDWDRLGGARIRPPSERDGQAGAAHNATTSRVARNAPEAYVAGPRMQAWHEVWAREAWRVLKPGGHLLAFGGTRTYHRLTVALEDAGFEIRDCLMWLYGSGFPKSLDVSNAIERESRPLTAAWFAAAYGSLAADALSDARWSIVAERAAAQGESEGWGTALKPAWEPIVVARRPLAGTVAGNVAEHGTGALNIDACRIEGTKPDTVRGAGGQHGRYSKLGAQGVVADDGAGRWPANVVLSHAEDCVRVGERQVRANGHHPAARGASGYGAASDSNAGGLKGHDELEERTLDGEMVAAWACVPGCPVRLLDDQAGELVSGANPTRRGSDKFRGIYADFQGQEECTPARGIDRGGPSRFFYCAKTSRAERNAGVGGSETPLLSYGSTPQQAEDADWSRRNGNSHPTVKPIDLMRWLVRLVTPPGGRVLDPFLGSGTTGCAAVLEGVEFVGIEREADYVAIAEARIRFWREHPTGLPVELALKAEGERRRARESGQLGLAFD